MKKERCIALYSGGLDSILAIKIIQSQAIDVIPLYFATPFFGFKALRNPEDFKMIHCHEYGICPHVIDYTDDFINTLINPAHGFGKYMNPCIDCRIGMLKRARELLEVFNASFIVTGEVLGQRPMSQRRDAMDIIEKASGLRDILLRPLCAKRMRATRGEHLGIVDREKLLDITGRGRKAQIYLAELFGIKAAHIPASGGGCMLTNKQIAIKVKGTINRFMSQAPTRYDIMLDVVGRKFILDDSTVFVVARNEQENEVLADMKYPGNVFIKIAGIPGPLCVLRGEANQANLEIASGICLRYGKGKGTKGLNALWGADPHQMREVINARVIPDEYCRRLQIDFDVPD
ncbi:MAG: thiamine biosynthesis protein [Deltaproteobacteria bacterium]|nr:thiamine biosynthesis protein [Deltaproteobacteria bacterium]